MIPKRMVTIVLQRDGEVCQLALPGCQYQASVADHRANRGSGGSSVLDDPVNLIAACGLCNGRKETATGSELEMLRERYVRIEKAATNEDTLIRARATPVKYRDGRWYLLDSAGGRTYLREVQSVAY